MYRLRTRRQRSSCRGCSIIDLLLAITLICTLCALLMQLFSSSRQMSYKSQCSSNLRRLAEAFTLYAVDWNGYWPCPGGLAGNRSYWSQSGSGGLQSYVSQRGINSIWCCPLLTEWHGKFPARSYSMNSYLREPADAEYPTCLGILRGINSERIPCPSRTILLFEGIPLTNGWEDKLDYIYRCANWSRARGYTDNIAHTIQPGMPWHGKHNNYLYCDGHLEARAPGRKTRGVLSTTSEMYEWYVDKARFCRIYGSSNAGTPPE